MNTYQMVVARLLELCEEKHLTQNKLANISGVPRGTVKSIFNGESVNPGIVNLKQLCDGLEMPLPDFFNTITFYELEQEIR